VLGLFIVGAPSLMIYNHSVNRRKLQKATTPSIALDRLYQHDLAVRQSRCQAFRGHNPPYRNNLQTKKKEKEKDKSALI